MAMKIISVTDIRGFKLGNAENKEKGTGCTVIVCEDGAVGGVDVRGGGPATRETDLLRSENTVNSVNAVVLSGGSAFGLEAASGVMRELADRKIGFDVGDDIVVPIVCGAALYDLPVGDPKAFPDVNMGIQAVRNAYEGSFAKGNHGAGTGATVGKLKGYDRAMKTGIGAFACGDGIVEVGAIAAVNAVGDIYNGAGNIIAGLRSEDGGSIYGTIKSLKSMVHDSINLFDDSTSFINRSEIEEAIAAKKNEKTAAVEEPSEEIIEESFEEPAEEPADEIIEEPAEESAEVFEEAAEEPAVEISEEPAEEYQQETVSEIVPEIEEIAEAAIEETDEEYSEEPVEDISVNTEEVYIEEKKPESFVWKAVEEPEERFEEWHYDEISIPVIPAASIPERSATEDIVPEAEEEQAEDAIVEPAEESSEETAEEPAEVFVEEPAEETAEEPAEVFIEEPAEETAEEPAEVFVEEPDEETAEEPVEVFVEEPAEETAEEPAEVFIEEPAEESSEGPAEVFVEEPVEEIAETPAEEIIEEPAVLSREDIGYDIVFNTTISCLITNAALTKSQANKLASILHDAYARAIKPVHGTLDGDTVFVLSTGKQQVNFDAFAALATDVMQYAIIDGAISAESAYGLPAARDMQKTGE